MFVIEIKFLNLQAKEGRKKYDIWWYTTLTIPIHKSITITDIQKVLSALNKETVSKEQTTLDSHAPGQVIRLQNFGLMVFG